ncbi:MCE family protein [Amycolatopsis jiangsuensis]|uniref:Virulence factor Mce-like protein n=1 Tax=Amycolatopsis jiangsuensis TaxID=1181879 RepID=A0A840J137_9PSEU|nr:MCE family protein [Amycolatopsis jiangsuensis]MBB4688706.1 virulence factor Mce-like protein [Amycolatopsis jiangsuensis]
MSRLGTQLAGVAFLCVLVLLGWLSVAIYDQDFSRADVVRLETDRVGSQLTESAEVKVRGVPFGEVRAIRRTDAGAELDLALDPAKIAALPRNVSARLLPKTLFGQRYVDLVFPPVPQGSLASGDVITQDRSSAAIEVERVLGDLLPLLRAVQPQKLNSSLGAISEALDNRGKPLGDSIVQLQDLLAEFNPLLPQVEEDLKGLAATSDVYTTAAPDILHALADLSTTAKTVVDSQDGLRELFGSVTSASDNLGDFVRENKENLIGVSVSSRPALQLLATYSPEFPCLFDTVNRLKPLMEKALGAGTGEPGLHVVLSTQDPREKYVPGRDTPSFTASGGPQCYGAGGGGAAGSALGPANSPGERELVSELLRPRLGEVPDWSSVLIGPALRGTEVTVR